MSIDIDNKKKTKLSGETIVILALSRFDSVIQSTSYTIAQELAKDNFVFYVDNPYTIKEFVKLKKNTTAYQLRKRFFSYFSNGLIDSAIPTLKIIISPIILSLHFLPEGTLYRSLLNLNEWIIARRIRSILIKKKVIRFIYINSANFHFPNLAKQFNPVLKVYHCVDPVYTGFDQKHGTVSEFNLINNTNLIICTSKQLQEEKKVLNNNTYFVPNAADVAQSSKALEEHLPLHNCLKDIKRPIIGYFGSIERRIDYELINEVIVNNRDKSFVFAGPIISSDIPDWFYYQPNLYLLGALPYHEMPSLIKGFNVAIIPFKKDEVSRTIFPLKLFEYLGAGKPIVATNFNIDLKEYTGNTVSFCEDATAFSAAIENELLDNNSYKISERVNVAQENTWAKRAMEISEIFYSNLNSI